MVQLDTDLAKLQEVCRNLLEIAGALEDTDPIMADRIAQCIGPVGGIGARWYENLKDANVDVRADWIKKTEKV